MKRSDYFLQSLRGERDCPMCHRRFSFDQRADCWICLDFDCHSLFPKDYFDPPPLDMPVPIEAVRQYLRDRKADVLLPALQKAWKDAGFPEVPLEEWHDCLRRESKGDV